MSLTALECAKDGIPMERPEHDCGGVRVWRFMAHLSATI